MVRSAGGWRELASAREAGIFLKSDERILKRVAAKLLIQGQV